MVGQLWSKDHWTPAFLPAAVQQDSARGQKRSACALSSMVATCPCGHWAFAVWLVPLRNRTSILFNLSLFKVAAHGWWPRCRTASLHPGLARSQLGDPAWRGQAGGGSTVSSHSENQSRAVPQGREPGEGLTWQLQLECAKLQGRDGGTGGRLSEPCHLTLMHAIVLCVELAGETRDLAAPGSRLHTQESLTRDAPTPPPRSVLTQSFLI